MVILLQLCIVAIVCCFRLWSLLGKHLKVSKYGESPEQLEYISYHKGRLNTCSFGLKQQHGFPFIVRRERWYHRLFKATGIASEVSLRDAELDKHWYFITDYPDHLERALHAPAFMEALRDLLQLPVKVLCSTPHRLWCALDAKQLPNALPRKEYWRRLEAIRRHVGQLPPASRQRFPLKWRAFVFLGLHMGLFLTACIGFAPTLLDDNEIISKREWLSHALIYALPTVCLWFAVIIAVFHGTSWAGWVLADFVLAGVVGVLVTAGYVVREVNILADTGAPQVVERVVTLRQCELRCHKSCGRRCTRRSNYTIADADCTAATRDATRAHYRARDSICQAHANYQFTLEVPHWQSGVGRTYRYNPAPGVYDRTRAGTVLRIPRREGALGIEWVDTTTIEPVAGQW